jgi:cell division protein FtsX
LTFLRPVHAFFAVVGRGIRGMLQAPLAAVLSITTISICMLLLAVVCLSSLNARSIVASWGVDVPVAVYLVDEANEIDAEALRQELLELPEVADAQLVTAEAAMERLVRGLGDDARWLEGIEPAVLPMSLELVLRPESDSAFAEQLADQLEAREAVDEVAVAGLWVGQVEGLLATLERMAIGVALGVSLASLAIVWSTIRLGVHARRTEIEILRLVGGTPRFVRGPFLVEGVLQGAAGAAVAIAVLGFAWDALEPPLARGLSLVFAAGSLRFFDPQEIAIGLTFGALVGLLGSRAAVARHART